MIKEVSQGDPMAMDSLKSSLAQVTLGLAFNIWQATNSSLSFLISQLNMPTNIMTIKEEPLPIFKASKEADNK
jgi:hypothetical protein